MMCRTDSFGSKRIFSRQIDYIDLYKFKELNGTSLCIRKSSELVVFVFINNLFGKFSKDEAAVRSLSEELEELIFQQSVARTSTGGWARKSLGNFLLEEANTPSHQEVVF